ncbi:hypothetical protein HMPREF0083_04072 [Aneurinibacillus aneurinilyticus ATCC 12856]|uniref:Uncharacterized protein n=1 Tax=Aneurinibacillus aneurinilyticus ATCC 12856 TaxID=649747 RepID=U1WYR1_ANEAE|nr:hypothetical protein HMPREF0083_04072 [Aneurinibacillus aneurinilyticus ATCC 12856]
MILYFPPYMDSQYIAIKLTKRNAPKPKNKLNSHFFGFGNNKFFNLMDVLGQPLLPFCIGGRERSTGLGNGKATLAYTPLSSLMR